MMNGCGLVCCYKMNNYGGTLQSYALQEYLNGKNVYSEMIDYTAKWDARKIVRVMRTISPYRFVYGIKRNLLSKKNKTSIFKTKENEYNNVEGVKRKFQDFRKKYYVTSPHLEGYKNLIKGTKQYSTIIIGSDQLWNVSNIFSEYYSIEFATKRQAKISYSTSIGLDNPPQKYSRRYKKIVNSLNNVSVREYSARDYLSKLTNKDITVVMDPVFLLTKDNWICYEKKPDKCPDEYVLTYIVGNIEKYKHIVERIMGEAALPVANIPNIRPGQEQNEMPFLSDIMGVGPAEFLWLINHATYIITDSFHGTAFSTIFGKQFLSLKKIDDGDKNASNDRIKSLLRRLGLEERLIGYNDDVSGAVHNQIDYEIINKKMDDQIGLSKTFLDRSLRDAGLIV